MVRHVLVAVILLAGCAAAPGPSEASPEPGRPYDIADGPEASGAGAYVVHGPHQVEALDYDFGWTVVEDPVEGHAYPVRVLGRAWLPDSGSAPVALLLHGQHDWCRGTQLTAVWYMAPSAHCRGLEPAWSSVPSHLGYEQVARVLASHGIAAVSIDANDINAHNEGDVAGSGVPGYGDVGMQARAQLILATLDGLQAAGAGDDVRHPALAGRLDLSRIGLMGHSRGAEGVTYAPGHAAEAGHWAASSIDAVWSLAGTPRRAVEGYQVPTMPHEVAYASVIPYCDGDVWNLGNADFHDTYVAAGHPDTTQLVFMGANHDYYNEMWPEDDALFAWADDPYCGKPDGALGYGRLSPEDQRRHQDVYLSAFFRLHLLGHSHVRPLLAGGSPPEAACPTGVPACAGLVHVSTTWTQRLVDATVRLEGGGALAPCHPAEDDECAGPRVVGVAPRWLVDLNGTQTIEVSSTLRGAPAPSHGALAPSHAAATPSYSASAPSHVTFRIALDAPDASPRPAVWVGIGDQWIDAAQHTAAIFPPPGDEAQRVVLHQVRIPVPPGAAPFPMQLRITGESGTVHLAEPGTLSLG